MAYALGRRLEYYDMPVVRSIVSRAGQDDYRLSSFVLGVVQSDAFQMKSAPVAVDQEPEASPPDARPGEGA